MKYLITGGAGFLGSNLAAEVLRRNGELAIIDTCARVGSENNINWLKSLGDVQFYNFDIRDADKVEGFFHGFRPDVVFHVAGQVAMTTSLANPREDFEINAYGTFNILEMVKNYVPNASVIYSSTNKVYGDLEYLTYNEGNTRYTVDEYPTGMPESLGLDFSTPYGCSKGTADQYMLDWARCYDLNTVVFRHSSIFGGRQFSTFDQGWIGWFVNQALKSKKGELDKPFTVAGNGKQVRDVLFAEDLVSCYFSALENMKNIRGEVFNIGGGQENSLSLLELFTMLEGFLDVKLQPEHLAPRKSDQKVFVADINKAKEMFSWSPSVTKEEGIQKMISWVDSL